MPGPLDHHTATAATGTPSAPDRWTTWHFGIVTLWSGGECGLRTLEWLATAEVPPNAVLYWVDNSGGRITARLRMEWDQRLRHRFLKLVWIKDGEPYRATPEEHLLHAGRHRHVADLYNLVFPRIFEETVLILEDDIVPPRDGIRSLLRLVDVAGRVDVAAGVYRDRVNPAEICASRDKCFWWDVPLYDALPPEPFEVGMTGGGFTLITNRALQQVLPVRCEIVRRRLSLGWDGILGKDLTALGFRLMVNPAVRCAHHCPEIAAYEAALRPRA